MVIAVMGITGTGKSTFIARMTGKDVKIGHDVDSETQDVGVYDTTIDGKWVAFVDTPGFDDTHRTDTQVLEQVAMSLAKSYEDGYKINGLIYLHRITDIRMQGTSLKNLRMFQKLVGDESLKNVVLATTMWDRLSHGDGEAKEAKLKAKHWDRLAEFGMQIRRLDCPEAGVAIVRELMRNINPVPLKIQRELVDEKKKLSQTAAGEEVLNEVTKATEEMKAQLSEVQEELRTAKESGQKNMDALKKVMEDTERELKSKLDQAAKDRETLQNNVVGLKETTRRHQAELQTKLDDADRERKQMEQAMESQLREVYRQNQEQTERLMANERQANSNNQYLNDRLRDAERAAEMARSEVAEKESALLRQEMHTIRLEAKADRELAEKDAELRAAQARLRAKSNECCIC